jgi:hypothetical protein
MNISLQVKERRKFEIAKGEKWTREGKFYKIKIEFGK